MFFFSTLLALMGLAFLIFKGSDQTLKSRKFPKSGYQAEQLTSKPGFVFMELVCHNIFNDPVGFVT